MIHFIPIIGGALTYVCVKLYKKHKKANEISSNKNILTDEKKSEDTYVIAKTDEQEKDIQSIEQAYLVSTFTFASSIGSIFYPPCILLSIFGMSYNLIYLASEAYKTIVNEHRVGIVTVDAIAVAAFMATGYYKLGAFTDWIFFSGQRLVFKIKDKSQKNLVNAFGELPATAWLLKDAIEVNVPVETLEAGDTVVVNAGEIIPADGTVMDGIALIDQQALTGESQPSEKEPGDLVLASTTVLSGKIKIKIDISGKETVVAKISEILSKTLYFKTTMQSRGEKIADNVALPTLGLSCIALATSGVSAGLAVLLSCIGDSMRIIAPVSTLNYLRIASHSGILIKDGRTLEHLNKVDTIVFDKTGTLTQKQPHVGKIYTFNGYDENEMLTYAAIAEYRQNHPIAKAIIKEAGIRHLDIDKISDDASYQVGHGIMVSFQDKLILVGSSRFMEIEGITISKNESKIIFYAHNHGHSTIMVAINGKLTGIIELHAIIRPEVKSVIAKLRKRNFSMYIISGDNEEPTKQLAKELGIDNFFAEILPEDKANIVDTLQKEGKYVCFIGDGINDSIALKKAHVSVSLQGASTIATDTADIILMKETLNQLDILFELTEKLEKNLKVCFISTIVPGGITIGGIFFLHFGVATASVLYTIGLGCGISNSMLPLLTHKTSNGTAS